MPTPIILSSVCIPTVGGVIVAVEVQNPGPSTASVSGSWASSPLNPSPAPTNLAPSIVPSATTAWSTALIETDQSVYWTVTSANVDGSVSTTEASCTPLPGIARVAACQPFAAPFDVLACCDCDLTLPDDLDLIVRAINNASDVLAALSGGRMLGRCRDEVRPCKERSCSMSPCCCAVDSIPLLFGSGPVVVVDVFEDGLPLAASDYRIDVVDGLPHLVRQGVDPAVMPRFRGCQTMWLPNRTAGTWSIVYETGLPVDLLAERAVVEIACELVKGCRGGSSCLPRGVESLVWQNTTVTVRDVTDEVTQIADATMPNTARFLGAYNPKGSSPFMAWSPDLTDGWIFHHV